MHQPSTTRLVRGLGTAALLAALAAGCGGDGSADACASVTGAEITDTCDDSGGGGTLLP